MEVIGNPNEFAIQYEIKHAYENECFGSIVFYLGGGQVGRDDYEVRINACINWFKNFNKHKSVRTYPNSHLLSKEEFFYELYEKFYNGTFSENGGYLKFGTVREVFHLDATGDASFRDFVSIILLDEPQLDRQRFIWRYYENENVKKEVFIKMNLYEEVTNQFCEQAFFNRTICSKPKISANGRFGNWRLGKNFRIKINTMIANSAAAHWKLTLAVMIKTHPHDQNPTASLFSLSLHCIFQVGWMLFWNSQM